jgi:chromate transporter
LKKLLELYWLFFYISATTFGGGYAMLPMFEREIAEKRGWATSEELRDYYAVSQSTPGVMSVNTATFVGIKRAGFVGGVAATLGVVTPSVIFACVFGGLLARYKDNPYVASAVRGMSVAAIACVCVTMFGLIKGEFKLWWIILAAFLLVAVGVPSYLVAILCALCGVLLATRISAHKP